MTTALVTGSTDGLGRRVAEELVGQGAEVIVHGRDPDKVAVVAGQVGAARSIVADLGSLDAVRRLAAEAGPLDLLINNAGLVAPERAESREGYELTFAVNYLAHFLLTSLLLDGMRGGARIVSVASIGQAPFDFDDPNFENGYDAYTAYARSKLAQITHAFALATRLDGRDVTVNALHPATLMDTKMVLETFGQSQSSVEDGVAAVMRAVTDPSLEGVSGRYFDGVEESRAHRQAYDADAQARLWELSEKLCRVG